MIPIPQKPCHNKTLLEIFPENLKGKIIVLYINEKIVRASIERHNNVCLLIFYKYQYYNITCQKYILKIPSESDYKCLFLLNYFPNVNLRIS